MKPKIDPSQVIESSKSLFKTYGFKKVTMIDIAEAAGISRPTLYSLYADKEAVFAACIRSHIEDFRKEAKSELQNEQSARRCLQALFRIYIVEPYSWYFESEDAFDMFVNASAHAPEEMALYWKAFESHIAELIERSPKTSKSKARDIAKVLVSFGRDARASSKNVKELERLIDTAIELAL